jgi:glycosyltransferase involved in cell wall biosynthesis
MRPGENHPGGVAKHSWNGNEVYVLPSEAYDPARTAFRFMSGQLSEYSIIKKLPNPDQFDAVHVRNDLSMALLAIHFKRQCGLPYAHQISHLKAESTIQLAKQGCSGSPLKDIIKGSLGRILRRLVVTQSDVTMTISDTMKKKLRERGYSEPIVTFQTGANTSVEPSSIDPKPFQRKYGILKAPLILYMGSMSPMRNLEFLFDVLDHLRKERDVTLLMVGGRDPDNRRQLQEEASNRGVHDHVVFTGWLESHQSVKRAIRAANIGLSPLPPTPILRTNAPLKVLEYLALETPVVASDTPDHQTVIGKSGAGSVVAYESETFAEAIDSLLASPDKLKQMGKAGRQYVERERSFEVITERLLEIYGTYLFDRHVPE